MRVLQVHNRYRDPGGEDAVADREGAALRAAGHDVVRYDISNTASTATTVASLAMAPWNQVEASRIASAIGRVEPDVVHFHNTWFRLSPSVIKAASDLGVPTVMTLHNYRPLCANAQFLRNDKPCMDCLTVGPTSALKYRCYKGSLATTAVASATQAMARRRGVWTQHVDRFIALTGFARETFASAGFPEDRIVVEANRVEDPGPRAAPPSASNTVLFVGRLDTLKGISLLCERWSDAPSAFELRVIGGGPLEAELRQNYPDIHFLGQRPASEVAELMRSSRAIIIPSIWYEGLPNVVVESLGHGLPMLISSTMAVSDDLGGLGSDWIFRVDAEDEWRRVFHLLDSGQQVDALSLRERKLFSERFEADDAASLLGVYESAIAERASRTTP